MAIQTNNSSDNSSTERARNLLNQNIELDEKRRKALQARIPSDPNAWQRMRENFEAILLGDPVFSEQNGIEGKLWQLHHSRIEELRAIFNAAVASAGSNPSQDGKVLSRGGPVRVAKICSQFKAFLTEATGFYHDLMLKIRAKYGLPLDSFYDDMDGQISLPSEVKKGLISCHRCFIYLGDLARYKGIYGEGDSKARDFTTASSYYMQANSLYPASGNPHHQLAILASYSDDVLVSIYRYFRSLAVDSLCTAASKNLVIVFEKNRQIYNQVAGDLKGNSASEVHKLFSLGFVRLNGILFTGTSLETFGEVFSVVRANFLKLLSEEYSFGPDDAVCRVTIVRLIAILVFTIHNVNRETVKNQSYAEIMQRSVLLQCAFTATFEFMGLILERCSQLKNPCSSYLLPGIMVFVEWLACHQDMAVGNDRDEKQANARLFFWNNFVAFLNKILSIGGYMYADENETTGLLALSEDFELRGFLPLLPAQAILNFSKKHSYGSDANKEKKVRVQRIIAAGKAVANVARLADKRVYFDKKVQKFFIGVEPRVSDVVEEEDDEVIVFKPASHFLPRADMNDTKGNLGISSGRFVGFNQPMFVSKANTDNLQPTGPGNLVNGMANLNLGKNGLFGKPENYHNAMQTPPLPSSLPQPTCINNGFNFSQPVPSKFDAIKPPSVMATEVIKKNPITRPLRPPGFDSLRSKVVDEPVSSPSLKTESTEIPQVDPYRLHSQHPYHNNISNFPFPGKTAMEKPKNRQDNFEFSEQTRLFQEQGHQINKGNQGGCELFNAKYCTIVPVHCAAKFSTITVDHQILEKLYYSYTQWSVSVFAGTSCSTGLHCLRSLCQYCQMNVPEITTSIRSVWNSLMQVTLCGGRGIHVFGGVCRGLKAFC